MNSFRHHQNLKPTWFTPWWPYHGLRWSLCGLSCLFSSYSFIWFDYSVAYCFFLFLLPTSVRLWCLCLCHRHPLPLSHDSFAPVGPSSVALRAISLTFWFLFLILFVCITVTFPPPSLSYHPRPRGAGLCTSGAMGSAPPSMVAFVLKEVGVVH